MVEIRVRRYGKTKAACETRDEVAVERNKTQQIIYDFQFYYQHWFFHEAFDFLLPKMRVIYSHAAEEEQMHTHTFAADFASNESRLIIFASYEFAASLHIQFRQAI